MKKIIGILPAAGIASRLLPFSYPKELLPVFFVTDRQNNKVCPKVAAEYSIMAMQYAGIKLYLVTISDNKTEIMRYFNNGGKLGINIAYLHQETPYGLPHAVNLGFEWFRDSYVCLALPDTIFYPFNAINIVRKKILSSQADLVLGVFPTSNPEQLGPVRFDSDGKVLEVLDKPKNINIFNTWGIAVWSPRFSLLLHQFLDASLENIQQPLGYIFNIAISKGLNVEAHFFEKGKYLDLGTAEGLGSLVFDCKSINFRKL